MSDSTQSNLDLTDMDVLLSASMDDLDDLPPVGAPPSGHYDLLASFDIENIGDDERPVVACSYTVLAINELKDPEEAGEVKVDQQFKEFFHTKKKNGEKNVYGIGSLKERLMPHADVFGTRNIGELITLVKQVKISATIKRTVNRKNEDQFNLRLSDIVVL